MIRVLKSILGLGIALSLPLEIKAAELQWGPNGSGGSGQWDTPNWWNGSITTTWSAGDVAVFGGAAGTVRAIYTTPYASGLIFNTSGYFITDGWINVSSPTFTITTNADARMNSLLNGRFSTLIKNGTGRLYFDRSFFADALQVDKGELILGPSAAFAVDRVIMANDPSAILTIGSDYNNSKSLHGLSGEGGLVRPDIGKTLNLALFDGGTFGGVLSDNGGGLSVDIYSGSNVQTLRGVNTYSGTTAVSSGQLALSGAGSILNTASIRVDSGLSLDNAAVAKNNRLADSIAITMNSAKIDIVGNSSEAIHEALGDLTLNFANQIEVTRPGAYATQLSFASIVRGRGATLNVTGAPGVSIGGLAVSGGGLLPTYITAEHEWAKLDGEGQIVAATDYNSNINAVGGLVKLTASAELNASISHQRLNLQGAGTLDLAGYTLGLSEGGLLSSGGSFAIANGAVDAGTEEFLIINESDLSIGAQISGGSLTKSGAGLLTLSGDNSYAGPVTITQGILQVSADRHLGTGDTIYFGGGGLRASGNFTSGKNIRQLGGQSGLVDTNGYDVTFTGEVDILTKQGSGSLTLTSNRVAFVTASAGTLILSHDSDLVRLTLDGGTVVALGRTNFLDLLAGTLDIGGAGAATFTTGGIRYNFIAPENPVTLKFDLGSQASDLLVISGPLMDITNQLIFDFSNLGGIQVGVDYQLIDILLSFGYVPQWTTSFSERSIADGWAGSFTTTMDGLSVRFTSIPEPSTWMLIGVAAVGLYWRRRRRG